MRLFDHLDYHARERPEALFARIGEARVGYAAAAAETRRLAQALSHQGLAVGDRVGILARNRLVFLPRIRSTAATSAPTISIFWCGGLTLRRERIVCRTERKWASGWLRKAVCAKRVGRRMGIPWQP